MGNENSSLCCDGDNSREITEVRKISREPAPKAAFKSWEPGQIHAQHSGAPGLREGHAAGLSGPVLRQSDGPVLRQSGVPGAARHAPPVYEEEQLPEGSIVSPRPRSARSDGASPAGFTLASLGPPNNARVAHAAFSHSPASPFAKKLAKSRSNGERARSSFANAPHHGHSMPQAHAQAPVGARGRTQSMYESDSLYYEDEPQSISKSGPGVAADYDLSVLAPSSIDPRIALV
jgi:hypothetical protein|eukprot:Tamp_20830.p1 GENE.Tamp_20830~~Tamp_20830.p1  ORF type:complete len:233 (-),score=13.44 Tamp_20830:264-962(-)